MKKRVLLLVACVSFLFLSSCARDALKGQAAQLARIITISYTLEENVDPTFYYFFVFNFSNSPSQDVSLDPYAEISSTTDRGRNWEEYIMFSPLTQQWGTLKKQPGQVDTDTSKWTDSIPFILQNQNFYISSSVSGATLTITLDATKFTDINGNVPKNFILQLITADAPIDITGNPTGLGHVYDWLVTPEIVQVTPGFLDNNLRSPQHLLYKNHQQAPAPANLTDWSVQVT